LKARKGKAFTAEEIMGSTSFHVDFDSPVTSKTSTFVAANFVAVLHDLVGKGHIIRKVVNNRMYFIATK
jgi:Pyruvate/2-oxoacid:ferredoxin oxidoreductase gamma subunit